MKMLVHGSAYSTMKDGKILYNRCRADTVFSFFVGLYFAS